MNLQVLSPGFVQARALEASLKWSDRHASFQRWGAEQEYLWSPGHAVHRQTNSPLQRWALQALPSSGTWTQHKMLRKGLATHSTCLLCGHLSATQWHRAFDCPGFEQLRNERLPAWVRAWVHTEGIGLFGPDLASLRFKIDNVALLHSTGNEHTAVRTWVHPDRVPEGAIYTDGAVQHPQIRNARAAGWARLQLDASGNVAR
eukprot:6471180-Amphidinium_carterae.2